MDVATGQSVFSISNPKKAQQKIERNVISQNDFYLDFSDEDNVQPENGHL